MLQFHLSRFSAMQYFKLYQCNHVIPFAAFKRVSLWLPACQAQLSHGQRKLLVFEKSVFSALSSAGFLQVLMWFPPSNIGFYIECGVSSPSQCSRANNEGKNQSGDFNRSINLTTSCIRQQFPSNTDQTVRQLPSHVHAVKYVCIKEMFRAFKMC